MTADGYGGTLTQMSHSHFSIVAVVVALLAWPSRSSAQALDPEIRTITTSGDATVYVVPDEIVIHCGVELFRKELADARSDTETDANRLVEAVLAMGVERKNVQASELSVRIDYDRADNERRVDGYFATRGFSITLRGADKAEKLEQLIATILTNGGNQLDGVEYRTTELRKHRDEARRMAAVAAREKAAALAEVYEMELGLPRQINESGGWAYAGYFGRSYLGGNASQNAVQFNPASDGGEAGGVPLGQIGVRATVGVTFDLVE